MLAGVRGETNIGRIYRSGKRYLLLAGAYRGRVALGVPQDGVTVLARPACRIRADAS